MLKKSFEVVDSKETITVRDRGHDSIGFMDMLYQLETDFVIRAKKNRFLTLEDETKIKC
jgi:acyl carrier protein